MTVFQVLLPAFVAGLILTGMLAYLGVHVVERGVIFVDLALPQIAALGTVAGVFMGYDLHSRTGYAFSLGFAFPGAAIFAVSRVHRRTRVPQEAIIGIAYAVAAAASILAMSKVTGETEHLKEMLVGNILSVSWSDLARTAALFGAVGLFHFLLRKKFLLITLDEPEAERRGLSIRFWDFLFYISFGFVVSAAVGIAGVLLVFSYLIVPAVSAMLFSDRLGTRLAIGWAMGAIVSALGVYLSYLWDLPTGATIVTTLGGALVVLAAYRALFRSTAAAGQAFGVSARTSK